MAALQVHDRDRVAARTLAARLDITPADVIHRALCALTPSLPVEARAAVEGLLPGPCEPQTSPAAPAGDPPVEV